VAGSGFKFFEEEAKPILLKLRACFILPHLRHDFPSVQTGESTINLNRYFQKFDDNLISLEICTHTLSSKSRQMLKKTLQYYRFRAIINPSKGKEKQ